MEKTKRSKNFWSLKKILVFWDPWQWKTLLAVCWANNYNRIYWNLSIEKNWKQIVKQIETMKDIEKIERKEERWLLILDEVSVNANSKDNRSNDNRVLIDESVFLQRKKNLDAIYLWQQLESFDIWLKRWQNVIVFECFGNMWFYYPMFLVERIKVDNKWHKEAVIARYHIDMIHFLNKNKLKYNTLENSKIKRKTKTKEK